MSYRTTYTNKYTGKKETHVYQGSEAGAKRWAESLSQDNDGRRAICEHIADGPYDYSGKVTHLITVGR